jgi:hypothetical protein
MTSTIGSGVYLREVDIPGVHGKFIEAQWASSASCSISSCRWRLWRDCLLQARPIDLPIRSSQRQFDLPSGLSSLGHQHVETEMMVEPEALITAFRHVAQYRSTSRAHPTWPG